MLNSPDLNKIKEDKSVTFKWNKETLLKVLKKRFLEEGLKDSEFTKKYFENEIKVINSKEIEIFIYIQ